MLGEERKKQIKEEGRREGKRDRLSRKIITTPMDPMVSWSSYSGLLSSGGIPQNIEFYGFTHVLLCGNTQAYSGFSGRRFYTLPHSRQNPLVIVTVFKTIMRGR